MVTFEELFVVVVRLELFACKSLAVWRVFGGAPAGADWTASVEQKQANKNKEKLWQASDMSELSVDNQIKFTWFEKINNFEGCSQRKRHGRSSNQDHHLVHLVHPMYPPCRKGKQQGPLGSITLKVHIQDKRWKQ